jgi:hypothetical protein
MIISKQNGQSPEYGILYEILKELNRVTILAANDSGGSGDMTGPSSSINSNIPIFSGNTGKILQDSGKTFSTDGTLFANSDDKIPTEKAVKTYADTKVPNTRTINGVDLSANRLIPSPNFIKRTGKLINAAITQEIFTVQALAANTLRAWPIDISVPTTLVTLHMEVTTGVSSTTCRMGLYADNGSNYPGAKIADHEAAGTIDTSSNGVKTKALTGGIISSPGRYWQVENSNGAPTLRSIQRYAMNPAMGFAASLGTPNQPLGWSIASVYSALPDTFPAGASILNVITPVMGWEEI